MRCIFHGTARMRFWKNVQLVANIIIIFITLQKKIFKDIFVWIRFIYNSYIISNCVNIANDRIIYVVQIL